VTSHEDKQPKPFADPVPGVPLFRMPPVVGGELVPTSPFDLTVPTDQTAATTEEQQPHAWLVQQPVTSLALSPDERTQQDAERDRLLGLCRHLRRTHRCPGECVLSPGRQERVLREIEGSDGGWSS
jgi:hypothetical protein